MQSKSLFAGEAHLDEQGFCKPQAAGSNPRARLRITRRVTLSRAMWNSPFDGTFHPMMNPFRKQLTIEQRIAALPVVQVVDIRAYSITNSFGYAYIGTESGPGSHELIFLSSPELSQRSKPWIENGELYGFMLPVRDIVSAD